MGSAQLLFSQVESYPLALLARGLLGCGDAMTYISVLRLVAGWFPARRYPVMVTLTRLVGMAGNVVATVPLTLMLTDLGWGPTFAIAGGHVAGLRAAAARPGRCARRTGGRDRADGPVGGRRVLQEVEHAWRLPAGRLASGSTCRRWPDRRCSRCCGAYPYLTQGLGTRPATRRRCCCCW